MASIETGTSVKFRSVVFHLRCAGPKLLARMLGLLGDNTFAHAPNANDFLQSQRDCALQSRVGEYRPVRLGPSLPWVGARRTQNPEAVPPLTNNARLFALILLCLSAPLATIAQDQKKHPVTEIKIRQLDPSKAAKVSFARQLKPLLTETCDECHSAEEHKGGFEITSVAHLIKGGKKASPAIIPGKPDESPFVQYLRGQREPQMPKGNPALTEDELHLVRLWILAGAKDDSDTVVAEKKVNGGPNSLRAGDGSRSVTAAVSAGAPGNDPAVQKAINVLIFSQDNNERLFAQRAVRLASLPKAQGPPEVKGPVFNEIDKFIVAKWEKDGLKEAQQPEPVCSDAVFLRRVYLDIIGVIPT